VRNALSRLIRLMTPWYDEDEAARREQSTASIQARSAKARRDAEAANRRVDEAFRVFGDSVRR
jgi:hypothetical protein